MITMATVHQADVTLVKGVSEAGAPNGYRTEDGFQVWRNDFGSNRWTVSIPVSLIPNSLTHYRDTCPVANLDEAKRYIELVRGATKTATRKRADAGTWTATATPPDAKGKSTLTVTGPDGVTMGESGKRAGAATHVVVRHNNPEADNGYWLNRNGHPYGYSIHGSADAAAKEADRARGDRQVGSGIPLSHQVWLVPVEHQSV